MDPQSVGFFIAKALLEQLPTFIGFAERLIGKGLGREKHLTVSAEMSKGEGALALDPRVKATKAALIDAQVAYVNAVSAAAAEAQALGIALPALPVVPLTPVTTPTASTIVATHPRATGERDPGDQSPPPPA